MTNTILIQAIQMLEGEELSHWSDAHDKVVLDVLRAALKAQPVQETAKQANLIRRLRMFAIGSAESILLMREAADALELKP